MQVIGRLNFRSMLIMIFSFSFFFSMVNNGQHSLVPRKIFAYEHFVSFVVVNIEVFFSVRNIFRKHLTVISTELFTHSDCFRFTGFSTSTNKLDSWLSKSMFVWKINFQLDYKLNTTGQMDFLTSLGLK